MQSMSIEYEPEVAPGTRDTEYEVDAGGFDNVPEYRRIQGLMLFASRSKQNKHVPSDGLNKRRQRVNKGESVHRDQGR